MDRIATGKSVGNVVAKRSSTGVTCFRADKKDKKSSVVKKVSSTIPLSAVKSNNSAISAGTSRKATKPATGKKTTSSSTLGKNTKTPVDSTGLVPRKSIDRISSRTSNSCFLSPLNSKSSLGGDDPGHRNSRTRFSDKITVQAFERQLAMLETMQTSFMKKLEALNSSMPKKLSREFKFVGIVQSEECKLLVHGDYLKKLPQILPAHAVADFKRHIQAGFSGCLQTVQEEVNNKRGLEVARLMERLEQEQAHFLSSLFDKMNDLFSETITSEQCEGEIQNEVLDSKHFSEDHERKMCELGEANPTRMTELELEIVQKNVIIADLTRKIEALEKVQQKPIEQEKHAMLLDEVNSLKESQTELTTKLQQSDIEHKIILRQVDEKNAEISTLQKELEKSKKLLEDVRSRAKAEASQPKSTNEQTQKDYAALEEKLIAARKELTAIQDSRVEVEQYKAQIKKLEEDLLKKDEELEEHYSGSEEDPDEIEIEHLYDLLQARADMIKTLRETENEQRNRIQSMVAIDSAKNAKIAELISELQNKTEAFETLLSTSESNQIKVAEQEKWIKLLEGCNYRTQMMRVKLEEQVSKLTFDMEALQQAIDAEDSAE